MPFTFAHPSVVLLIKNKFKRFDITALVIGSMAPDFEYFIHFQPYQVHGHTLMGQIYYNLPLVLLISIIFHYLLKEPFICNLPKPYDTYYYYLTTKKWRLDSIRVVIVFIYSALIGMITHLIWDGFTHQGAIFVSRINILNFNVSIFEINVPTYKLLQHGGTIIGLIIVGIYLIRIQCKQNNKKSCRSIRQKKIFWCSMTLLSIVIFILLFLFKSPITLGIIVVGGINAILISLIMISIIDKIIIGKKVIKN